MSEIDSVKQDEMVSEVAEDPTVGRPCTVDVQHWREQI
jgi:hypothetical protein